MSTCQHQHQIRVLCIYEGCTSPNLLMCQSCLLSTHPHPITSCVRLDYLQKCISPARQLFQRKQILMKSLHAAIQIKKQQLIQQLDLKEKQLNDRYLNLADNQESELLMAIKREEVPNSFLSDLHKIVAGKGDHQLDQLKEQLVLYQKEVRLIGEIQITLGDVRPGKRQSESPNEENNKVSNEADKQAHLSPSQDPSPLSEIRVEDIVNEDTGKEEESLPNCCLEFITFEEAIKGLLKIKNQKRVSVRLSITKKEQKLCNTFLESIEYLKTVEAFSLEVSNSFVFYRFNVEILVKALTKLPLLKEVQLEMTVRDSEIESVILPKLQKRMDVRNITLRIHKM